MNERELIKKAKSGDFDAFNELIKTHIDSIFRLALKITKNRDDAEDIVQNTFFKAIDKLDQFREESSFNTWVYKIALNETRSHIHGESKFNVKPIEEYLPGAHEDESIELYDWGDPHADFEKQQLRDVLDNSLADMDDKYSVPFILKYVEEMPVKQIADILDLSVAATKSRILRARLALRDLLSSHIEGKEIGQM